MVSSELENRILEKLSTIIDPETGTDVIRMRLVQNLSADDVGKVAYTFRPSSPLCPIAVALALTITAAVREVPGVTGQDINVVDYIQADMLNKVLKTA